MFQSLLEYWIIIIEISFRVPLAPKLAEMFLAHTREQCKNTSNLEASEHAVSVYVLNYMILRGTATTERRSSGHLNTINFQQIRRESTNGLLEFIIIGFVQCEERKRSVYYICPFFYDLTLSLIHRSPRVGKVWEGLVMLSTTNTLSSFRFPHGMFIR